LIIYIECPSSSKLNLRVDYLTDAVWLEEIIANGKHPFTEVFFC